MSKQGQDDMSSKTQTRKQPAKKRTPSRTPGEVKPSLLLKESSVPTFAGDNVLIRVLVYFRELKAMEEVNRKTPARPSWMRRLLVPAALAFAAWWMPAGTTAKLGEQVVATVVRSAISPK